MFASLVAMVPSVASTMTLIVGMNPFYMHMLNTTRCFGRVIDNYCLKSAAHFRSLNLNLQTRDDRVSASHRTSCNDLNGRSTLMVGLTSCYI